MTQPNATPTLSTWQNSDPRFAVGHESSPKNDISLVLRSEHDYEQAKSELAFLEEKYSEVSANDLEAFHQRMSELATAISSYEGKVTTSIKLIDGPLKYNTALFQECAQKPLLIRDGDSGDVVTQYSAPEGGWTLTAVQERAKNHPCQSFDNFDATVGSWWLGSTEI
ncbi:hypothetical protein [Vibrio sp. ER1A]|uniref:hypothetical protein n=1 Tax=Vibrio sp. ER1A TaxID=1517681 RepID=UPI0004DCFA36|nr:hypothetical protein [Vibrio sp. ER1A]KFA99512.1 hypothetical protein HW45_03260 [Vibrio sp. ER1A]